MSGEKFSRFHRFAAWVDGEEWCGQPAASPAPREKKPRPGKGSSLDRYQLYRRYSQLVGAVFCLTLFGVLMATVLHLPLFGSPDNPTNNEVSQRYIERGIEETGAANIVAGMILSYRVFDTFGESSVLFLAATCVTILLRRDHNNTTTSDLEEMAREDRSGKKDRDMILRTAVLILLPLSALVGVYVMLFGHISPGGGFSGGAILGGGMILYAQTFGNANVRRFFNEHMYHLIKVVCLMGYGLFLVDYVMTGSSGLPGHVPLGIPGHIISAGIIMPIDLLVGFEVTCTIYAFYALFSKGEL